MVYVITGGPGFGKTTLINLLASWGYPTCPEMARELIREHSLPGTANPFLQLPAGFEKVMAEYRIDFLQSVPTQNIAFADRGLPDQVAYSRWRGKKPGIFILEAAAKYRYAEQVFITPPWPEIFRKDSDRKEDFDQACAIHQLILEVYGELGYEPVEIPPGLPEERVKFILGKTGLTQNNA